GKVRSRRRCTVLDAKRFDDIHHKVGAVTHRPRGLRATSAGRRAFLQWSGCRSRFRLCHERGNTAGRTFQKTTSSNGTLLFGHTFSPPDVNSVRRHLRCSLNSIAASLLKKEGPVKAKTTAPASS